MGSRYQFRLRHVTIFSLKRGLAYPVNSGLKYAPSGDGSQAAEEAN
jgi:hypothetical protein